MRRKILMPKAFELADACYFHDKVSHSAVIHFLGKRLIYVSFLEACSQYREITCPIADDYPTSVIYAINVFLECLQISLLAVL